MSQTRREDQDVHAFWTRIPFGAWLKISGPTFAVMALGFGAMWNAQQATTQQILDLQQSTTQQILELQESTTDRILELQESTTDRILDMQQQILDMNRESRAERG
jgi:TolA-binding protein